MNNLANRKRILFTSTFSTPFINNDKLFLSKYFELNSINEKGINFYIKLFRYIFKSDISFSWFLSTYSASVILLMTLLKRKSVVILGGVDVAKEKSLSYGIWNNPFKSLYLKFALKRATYIFAVDESLKKEIINRTNYDFKNIYVISTSVDFNFWKPKGIKSEQILMVANASEMNRLKLKGVDFFCEIAKSLPEYKFVLIGIKNELQKYLTKLNNLSILEFVEHSELLKWYQSSKVYCQLSLREGLPNTLLEAMSCGCIPIGTKVGGIETLISNNGYFVSREDTFNFKSIFNEALNSPDSKSIEIRNFISDNYNPINREKLILNYLNEI